MNNQIENRPTSRVTDSPETEVSGESPLNSNSISREEFFKNLEKNNPISKPRKPKKSRVKLTKKDKAQIKKSGFYFGKSKKEIWIIEEE